MSSLRTVLIDEYVLFDLCSSVFFCGFNSSQRGSPLSLGWINANATLRPSVAAAFGFDPFERVVDFLAGQLARRG
jgi:hypothetical protein